MRVHHSFIVNLNNVQVLNKKDKELIMLNGDLVPVSRRYYNKVHTLFK